MSLQNNREIDPEIVEITAEQDTESSSRNKIATLEALFFELDKRDERLLKASIHKMRKIGLAALFLVVLGWLVVICTFLFWLFESYNYNTTSFYFLRLVSEDFSLQHSSNITVVRPGYHRSNREQP